MLILGIDPGSKWCGYALLLERAERIVNRNTGFSVARVHLDYVMRGEFESAIDNFSVLGWLNGLQATSFRGQEIRIALEAVAGYAYKPTANRGGGQAVVKALLETSRVAGGIERELRPHYEVDASRTAIQCRTVVGCNRRAGPDAAVKVAVQRIVKGWPKRSNVHQRDAALCAIAYSFVTRYTRNH